jgi:hypothetical protein
VSPSVAVELARLLLADASRVTVEERLAREPTAPNLGSVILLGERARRARASVEELALALGLLQALRTESTTP